MSKVLAGQFDVSVLAPNDGESQMESRPVFAMTPSSGEIIGHAVSPDAFTPQFLADTTLSVLSEEEQTLPCGFRGFRECDVQFLLWRKLLLLGYKAAMEEKRTDIVVFDDQKMIAAIELKGPWLARNFRIASAFSGDFEKHCDRIVGGLPGHCYSLWIFTGRDETAIQMAFDKFLECASTAAPDCLVESSSSSLLRLNKQGGTYCRVYAVRVYRDILGAVVT